MTSPRLLFHTVRHLRPRQVVSRVYYRVADAIWSPGNWHRRLHAADLGECRWRPLISFLMPEQQKNLQAAIEQGRFRFQNEERCLGCPIDWNSDNAPLLWRYNLHYFDYLWSLEFDAAREIALDWINRHTIGRGQIGWDPYPTSLRLLNWCGYFFGKHMESTRTDRQFLRAIQRSLAGQAARLSCRMEYHLLGNHLLENAAALVCIGSCFDGPAARRCLRIGLQILRAEMREQILSDGVHFELSPMYHSRILHLVLNLMNIVSEELRDWLAGYASKMLDALHIMTHPDGEIALLNDSALGVYPSHNELAGYAGHLGTFPRRGGDNANETFALRDAGYFGARTGEGHYIVCDAGKVGPDYIPGHAHGDIFSFELSLFGERVIVDSGVHDYCLDGMRGYCRSTAAHNTVEIDGQDQCEFWDAFKVARRGRALDVHFEQTERGFRLRGWHDGYRRLPGRPTHRREFQWSHDGVLTIRDTVESSVAVPFVSRFHLHPECGIVELWESGLVLERGGRRYAVRTEGGQLQIGRAWYCREFGAREENLVLEIVPSGVGATMGFHLSPCE